MIELELSCDVKAGTLSCACAPYVFTARPGEARDGRIVQSIEYFVEWAMGGHRYAIRFQANQGQLVVQEDGRCVAHGRCKGWSMWGTFVYDDTISDRPAMIAQKHVFNPKSRYFLGKTEIARLCYRKWWRQPLVLTCLADDPVHLPIVLADIIYSFDERKTDCGG